MTTPHTAARAGEAVDAHAPVYLQELQDTVRHAFRILITDADDNNNELAELPLGQFRCLRRVIEKEGCKLVDLARETHLSLPNASRLVDRLVQRGLVTRETDPHDRRAVRLNPTAEARAMIDAINGRRMQHLQQATHELPAWQVRDITHQIQKLVSAANTALAHAPGFCDEHGVATDSVPTGSHRS